jgi:signal transduction histidine kinase
MRISGFIRQLLHLARLEHSAHVVELSPCNIGIILRNQVEYFEVMAEQEGVTIFSNIPKKRYMIQGNKRLLEELFTNLVINAIKYKRTGIKSSIHIGLIETDEAIVISVKDNGIGIAPEHLQDIFTRFHRASNENVRALGSGLGLAIVKRIIDRHKGTIVATSIMGQETEFRITFPKI